MTESADSDDGSCSYSGCMDPAADNYDANADTDDGSCYYSCPDGQAQIDSSTISLSVYVKDANGVGVPEIPVSFANNTPNYGILEAAVVYTDSIGVAAQPTQ